MTVVHDVRTGTKGVAGFIPIGIPTSNFVVEQRKMQSFVCFPEVGFPWDWTARAFFLRDQVLLGPMWSLRVDSCGSIWVARTAGIGASRPLDLRAGNGSSCPITDLAADMEKLAQSGGKKPLIAGF